MLQLLASKFIFEAALLLPVAIWMGLYLFHVYSERTPQATRIHAAAFLAFVWQFIAFLVINVIAYQWSFWHSHGNTIEFHDVRVDAAISMAIWCGPLAFLLLRRFGFLTQFAATMGVMFGFYLMLPFVYFPPEQNHLPIPPLLGHMAGLALFPLISFAPSLKLAEWTADDTRLYARATLQTIGWAGVLVWFIPSLFDNAPLFFTRYPAFRIHHPEYLLPMLVPVAMLFSALRQFAMEGGGTAFPYDPPKRMVTGGVYAYISNPMQVGICLLMLFWGLALENEWTSYTAGVAFILFLAFKNLCNGSCTIGEQDPHWAQYQQEVRRWIPRLTPWRKPS